MHPDDGMNDVLGRSAEADFIVLAMPIYFYGASAQMEAVMGRLYTPKRNEFKVRSLVLLAVGATKVPNLSDAMLAQYGSILRFFNLNDLGRVLVNGVKDPGDIIGGPELKEAEDLGRSIR